MNKHKAIYDLTVEDFGCKDTTFAAYVQVLAAKNAVYLQILTAIHIFLHFLKKNLEKAKCLTYICKKLIAKKRQHFHSFL